MVDFHTHLLPYIDDGAKDETMSLEMLNMSLADGVELCVATPHCVIHTPDDIDSFITSRRHSYKKLKTAMAESGKAYPDIILGAEVYLNHDISTLDGIERLCVENTNCMLIEFPHIKQDPRTTEWLYSIMLRGIQPIVAHIDRYPKRESIIADMQGMNLVYQINASNFLSFGTRRLVKKLIMTGELFLVSSDMHNTSSRRCNMASAYKQAKKLFPDIADDMFAFGAKELFGFDGANKTNKDILRNG